MSRANRSTDPVRSVDDDERRARLARRLCLHPGDRASSAVEVANSLVALHATERATIHLAVRARVDDGVGLTAHDVETALVRDRSLVLQLAMRRTLFAFDRDLLPAVWGSAAARTAASERRRLAADLERSGIDDGDDWLDRVGAAVVERLADGDELDATTLRAEVPDLDRQVRHGSGNWSQEAAIGPRLITLLGAQGRIVRAGNQATHWRVSRPRWAATAHWLGDVPAPWGSADGYAELVRRWLFSFGPGTEDDLVWWFGATKSAVRHALATVDAAPVALDDGEIGWLLADDLEPVESPEPWVALLPTLDPTTMGWKHRDFYLDPDHRAALFDRNGNGGTTAWCNGRVVGCYTQRDNGEVEVHLIDDPGREATDALAVEAQRLTGWLDGTIIKNVYKSPMMVDLRNN